MRKKAVALHPWVKNAMNYNTSRSLMAAYIFLKTSTSKSCICAFDSVIDSTPGWHNGNVATRPRAFRHFIVFASGNARETICDTPVVESTNVGS